MSVLFVHENRGDLERQACRLSLLWGPPVCHAKRGRQARGGLPAGDADIVQDVDPPPVAAKDVRTFAAKLSQELSAREDFAIGFAADWDSLAKSDVLRALSCDAMRNATYAVEQVARTAKRALLFDRIHIVRIIPANKAGVVVQKGILAITIAPQQGPAGRPSSLAIMRALQTAF